MYSDLTWKSLNDVFLGYRHLQATDNASPKLLDHDSSDVFGCDCLKRHPSSYEDNELRAICDIINTKTILVWGVEFSLCILKLITIWQWARLLKTAQLFFEYSLWQREVALGFHLVVLPLHRGKFFLRLFWTLSIHALRFPLSMNLSVSISPSETLPFILPRLRKYEVFTLY